MSKAGSISRMFQYICDTPATLVRSTVSSGNNFGVTETTADITTFDVALQPLTGSKSVINAARQITAQWQAICAETPAWQTNDQLRIGGVLYDIVGVTTDTNPFMDHTTFYINRHV